MWKLLRRLGLNIQRQESSPCDITLNIRSARSGAQCPLCGRVSRRKHSHYTRFLMDLPADGRTVNIHLTVRRFRCTTPTCHRSVFAERFPQFVRPHARRTERLDDLLTRIGVLLGGEPGARLAQDLCAPVSPDTILRLVYRMDFAPVTNLRVVGIDDWAWRKGVRYGTIVCDLETRRPVDLLPEARTAMLAQWLAKYPGIEVVTRARVGVYADGAASGAPHALQVADRWHLLRNLGDVAERVLVGVSIPPIPIDLSQPVEIASSPPQPSPQETRREAERRQRHQLRQALYEQVHKLYRETQSIRVVAAQLGIDRRTVRRYLDAPECPLPKPRGKRSSILDPYRAYILTRWREGCHNAAALYREIVDQGYRGGITIVKDFVKTLRSRPASEPVIRHVRLGPKRLRRWFARPPEKLGDEERHLLGLVLDASPELREAYALLQAFRKILGERNTEALRS